MKPSLKVGLSFCIGALLGVAGAHFSPYDSAQKAVPQSRDPLSSSAKNIAAGGTLSAPPSPISLSVTPKVVTNPSQWRERVSAILSVKPGRLQAAQLVELFDSVPPSERHAFFGLTRDANFNSAQKKLLASLVIQRWAEVSPSGAQDEFSRLSSQEKLMTVESLSGSLAEKDPAFALAWAQNLAASPAKNIALTKSLSKLVEADSTAALAALDKLEPSISRALAPEVFASWVDVDPTAAVAAALKKGKEGGNNALVRETASRWASNDPAGAIAWVSQNAGGSSEPSVKTFASSLFAGAAALEPKLSLDMAMGMQSNDSSTLMRSTALGAWLAADPTVAKEWFKTQSQTAAAQILEGVTRTNDPYKAAMWLELAEGLPSSTFRTSTVQNLVKQMASVNAEQALTYLSNSTDMSVKTGMLPSVAQMLAKTDPELGFTTVYGLPTTKQTEEALAGITMQWARKEPAALVSKLAELPDVPQKTSLMASAAATWASSDPSAASKWALSLKQSEARDVTLQVLATSLSTRNPEIAATVAQAISNEQIRNGALWQLRR